MDLIVLTELLGWAAVINMGLLIFSTVILVLLKGFISTFHGKIFKIPADQLPMTYFNYLANYKILTLVFFVAPYLALKVMGY
jgi:hypothetical protein